jgi:hypothetical protein
MKSLANRVLAGAALTALLWLMLANVSAPRAASTLSPDKIVILSTTDVKGKTSPCG